MLSKRVGYLQTRVRCELKSAQPDCPAQAIRSRGRQPGWARTLPLRYYFVNIAVAHTRLQCVFFFSNISQRTFQTVRWLIFDLIRIFDLQDNLSL